MSEEDLQFPSVSMLICRYLSWMLSWTPVARWPAWNSSNSARANIDWVEQHVEHVPCFWFVSEAMDSLDFPKWLYKTGISSICSLCNWLRSGTPMSMRWSTSRRGRRLVCQAPKLSRDDSQWKYNARCSKMFEMWNADECRGYVNYPVVDAIWPMTVMTVMTVIESCDVSPRGTPWNTVDPQRPRQVRRPKPRPPLRPRPPRSPRRRRRCRRCPRSRRRPPPHRRPRWGTQRQRSKDCIT